MSYIKCGTCKKCREEFHWSVGHPDRWNSWAWAPEDMSPSQRWWFSFGSLCQRCAPPMPEDSGISIMMTTGPTVQITGTDHEYGCVQIVL